MHNAALAALGLEGVYSRRRVDVSGMIEASLQMRAGELHGANITMPHKGVAAGLADRLSPDAERSGSVNTWLMEADGVLGGHSTDVEGIRRVWARAGFPDNSPVLLIGAGGAAAAAMVALEGRRLWCSARRPEAVAALAQRVDVVFSGLRWGESRPGAVVVNATPLGMRGGELPRALLDQASGLFDMAYRSDGQSTAGVRLIRDRGLAASDGLAMLAAQAEASFQLWTGVCPPEGVMEQVARMRVNHRE
jgi:shikimate dehydrogenase